MPAFDTIKCEYNLPDFPEVYDQSEYDYQTYDLDGRYRYFVITTDGYIVAEHSKGRSKIKFDGILRFGTFINSKSFSSWIEYEAVFEKSKLVSIKLLELEI